uniref:C2H2-type domain-containing protein n=1 Tax=Musca domestica TaxID=7370 RepID=A0A1I8MNQ4_MUSDO
MHMKAVHLPKAPRTRQQCKYCQAWLASKSGLRTHILNMHVHADVEHRCEICGFVSTSREAKKRHIQFKHNPEKRHKCSVCDKSFKVAILLREHMATHTGVDLYKCLYCDATFKSKSNRSTHSKRVHPVEYEKAIIRRPKPCGIKNFETSSFSCEKLLAKHQKDHPAKEYICETCGKVTPTLAVLKRHVRKVHDPKVPAQCTYCGKWYVTRSLMLRHVLNMHTTADSEHRCDICGFVSSTRSATRQHKRFKHNPEKRHKCTMCEKAFKTPTLLKEHLATHTGIDLYKCAYCEATFKSKSNRSTHYRRHHPVEYNANMIRRPKPTAIPKYEQQVASSSNVDMPSSSYDTTSLQPPPPVTDQSPGLV